MDAIRQLDGALALPQAALQRLQGFEPQDNTIIIAKFPYPVTLLTVSQVPHCMPWQTMLGLMSSRAYTKAW